MWFFKKRDDSHRWNNLYKTLTKSFNHIKYDVTNINKRIEESHETHKAHKRDILILHRRLSRIESLVEGLIINGSQLRNESKTAPIKEDESYENTSSLTNLQKSILVNLSIILSESSKEWISMRDLAQELYPNKKYSKIKSLLSAYTDLLVDLNLIKKERKGRDTYLSLTPKAEKHIKKVKLKKET